MNAVEWFWEPFVVVMLKRKDLGILCNAHIVC